MKNRERAFSIAAAGIAHLACLVSASFLLPGSGPMSPTGSPEKLIIAISAALKSMPIKIAALFCSAKGDAVTA